jgi:hypothetical protein
LVPIAFEPEAPADVLVVPSLFIDSPLMRRLRAAGREDDLTREQAMGGVRSEQPQQGGHEMRGELPPVATPQLRANGNGSLGVSPQGFGDKGAIEGVRCDDEAQL